MRKGQWMQTLSGGVFYPLDPRPEEMNIVDIAGALSKQCRYFGHCLDFYSVAEHCCHISDLCPPEHKLWGLLHDASEAYLCDILRPIKPNLTNYLEIEARLMLVVCQKYELQPEMPDVVKELDRRILNNEREQLMSAPPIPWDDTGPRIEGLTLHRWSHHTAMREFLKRYIQLTVEWNETS